MCGNSTLRPFLFYTKSTIFSARTIALKKVIKNRLLLGLGADSLERKPTFDDFERLDAALLTITHVSTYLSVRLRQKYWIEFGLESVVDEIRGMSSLASKRVIKDMKDSK